MVREFEKGSLRNNNMALLRRVQRKLECNIEKEKRNKEEKDRKFHVKAFKECKGKDCKSLIDEEMKEFFKPKEKKTKLKLYDRR